MGNIAGKKRIILTGLALLITLLLCVPAYAAQVPSFRLDMDSLNLSTGVSSTLVITLENAQGAQIKIIEGIENFDLMSQSSSSSTSIINGAATSQNTFYYTIMPTTVGQFTLKATIEYNGRTYETNELYVMVSDGSGSNYESAQDLFVKTALSHTEAYLGEKIVMTYVLYTRYNIEGYGFSDSVYVDGMIIKDMQSNQLKAEYAYVGGERYAMYEVIQYTIDPLQSGEYTIPSFNFRVDVLIDGGMGGGFGFFHSSTPMYIQTESKGVTIKPLPSAGKPPDFSGIVGELRLDGNFSRENINYGESFVLNVMASGTCNLDGFNKIVNVETPGFSAYETQKNTTESIENEKYHVQKVFDVIFVPERTGVISIPPIPVSYFSPVTEKYEVAEIQGVSIEVLGDMPHPASSGNGQSSAIETMRIEQVNYMMADDGYFSIQMKKEAVYGILIGLAVLLVLLIVLSWLRTSKKTQDATLKSLYKKIMSADDINEIFDLLSAVIKHCFRLSLKACSKNTIQSSLPDAALAAQLTEIMDYMESTKSCEPKGHLYLKDKIKSIYPVIVSTRI